MPSAAAAKTPPVSVASLSVAKISSADELENLCREWELLAEACAPNNFFQSWDFATCWWKAYGEGHELFIVVCRDDQHQLVGIAPLYRETSKNRIGLDARKLRLVGDGSDDADGFGFLLKPGSETEGVLATFEWLAKNRAEWDLLEFVSMSEESAAAQSLLLQIKQRAWVERATLMPHLTLELPATWEDYLRHLSTKVRQTWLRKIRRAEQSHVLRLRKTASISELERDLATVFELHNKSWRARNANGKLEATERCEFYRLLCHAAFEKDLLDLWLLEVDGIARAARLGFLAGNTRHAMLAGMDPDFAHLSLGTVIEAFVLKKCIERGDKVYDFLAGDEPYKLECRPKHSRYVSLAIARQRTRAGVRLAAQASLQEGKHWLRGELPVVYEILRKASAARGGKTSKPVVSDQFSAPHANAASIRIQALRDHEAVQILEPSWNSLLSRSLANSIFSTWEWMTAWLAAYGRRDLLTLAGFTQRGQLVGIAPFYISPWPKPGRRALRILRLLGGDTEDAGSLGIISAKGSEQQFADALIDWLSSNRSQYDAIELGHISDAAGHALLKAIQQRKWATRQQVTSHMVIDLPDTVEAFQETLSGGRRGSLAAAKKKVATHFVEFHRSLPDDANRVLDDLFRLHAERWKEKGSSGAFALAARREFYRQMVARLPGENLDIWTMSVDGITVAVEFGLVYSNARTALQSGFDPGYAKFNVGALLEHRVIESAIRRGLRFYDLLEGEQEYKKRWGARPRKLSSVRCAPSNTIGAAWVKLSGSNAAQKLWQRLKRTPAE